MDAEIDLENVLLFEDCVMLRGRGLTVRSGLTSSVSPIRGVMRSTVVQTEARWETDTAFKSTLLHESSCAILDVLSNLNHRLPWLDELARGSANLPVYLCPPADAIIRDLRVFHGHAFIVTLLLRGGSPRIATGASEISSGRT
jgi:hypothetical protein